MKSLILARHAKSSWDDPTVDDHARSLNKRGERDVQTMALRLAQSVKRHNLSLQRVVSSTAVRAKLYGQAIADHCHCSLELDRDCYTFSSAQLLNHLLQLPQELDSVAVVGHNPAMTILVNELSNVDIDNMPTSAFILLECDIDNWSELTSDVPFARKPQSSTSIKHKVLEFDFPKKSRH